MSNLTLIGFRPAPGGRGPGSWRAFSGTEADLPTLKAQYEVLVIRVLGQRQTLGGTLYYWIDSIVPFDRWPSGVEPVTGAAPDPLPAFPPNNLNSGEVYPGLGGVNIGYLDESGAWHTGFVTTVHSLKQRYNVGLLGTRQSPQGPRYSWYSDGEPIAFWPAGLRVVIDPVPEQYLPPALPADWRGEEFPPQGALWSWNMTRPAVPANGPQPSPPDSDTPSDPSASGIVQDAVTEAVAVAKKSVLVPALALAGGATVLLLLVVSHIRQSRALDRDRQAHQ